VPHLWFVGLGAEYCDLACSSVGYHEKFRYRGPESRYEFYEKCLCSTGAIMKSKVIKRSVIVDGHKTSVCLEDAFWSCLNEIAEAQGATVSEMVTEIDRVRQRPNLSSAIRLFVLDWVRNRTGLTDLREEKRVPGASAERGHLTTP
jgi:predicted DNA-binding ribbon-helix-helix protein